MHYAVQNNVNFFVRGLGSSRSFSCRTRDEHKNDDVISIRFAGELNKETIFHLHHESSHCSFKASLPPTRSDPQS